MVEAALPTAPQQGPLKKPRVSAQELPQQAHTEEEYEHLVKVVDGFKTRMRAVKRAMNGDFDQEARQSHQQDLRDELYRAMHDEVQLLREQIMSAASAPQQRPPALQDSAVAADLEELHELQQQCKHLREQCQRARNERDAVEQQAREDLQQLQQRAAKEIAEQKARVTQLEALTSQANSCMKSMDADRTAAVAAAAAADARRREVDAQLEAALNEKIALLERARAADEQHEREQRDAQEQLSLIKAAHTVTLAKLDEAHTERQQRQESHEELANKLAEARAAKAVDAHKLARLEKENEELRTRVIVLEQVRAYIRGTTHILTFTHASPIMIEVACTYHIFFSPTLTLTAFLIQRLENAHRDQLGRQALSERTLAELNERVKELTAANTEATTSLTARAAECARLQSESEQLRHENDSLSQKLREVFARELERDDKAADAIEAAAAAAAAASVASSASIAFASASTAASTSSTSSSTCASTTLPASSAATTSHSSAQTDAHALTHSMPAPPPPQL